MYGTMVGTMVDGGIFHRMAIYSKKKEKKKNEEAKYKKHKKILVELWPPTGPSGSALGIDRNLSHKGLDTGLINPLMNTILSSVVPDKKYRKRERK